MLEHRPQKHISSIFHNFNLPFIVNNTNPNFMKRLLCFAIAVSSYFVVVGQPGDKSDVVFKTNGDQLKGQVVEVTDDNIRFKYSGEQVIYTFKRVIFRKLPLQAAALKRIIIVPQPIVLHLFLYKTLSLQPRW